MLRATYERVLPLAAPDRVWVVTAAAHARRVRRELPEIPPGNVLREPAARNTGPAVTLASRVILARDPEATLAVVPADSWVPQAGPYRSALRSALAAAERHRQLVLVGVRPTRPETGYGYIEPGAPLSPGKARAVKRFVEKPVLARARSYLKRGFLWNCGIFAWRAEDFLATAEKTMPEVAQAFRPLQVRRVTRRLLERAYAASPTVSVDYGVMERADNCAVIPARFAWDDLGSWPALARLGTGSSFTHGTVIAEESPGLVAWAEQGVVAVVGVPDVVVVHTPDATLVVRKDLAQEVRSVVAKLEKNPRTRTLIEE